MQGYVSIDGIITPADEAKISVFDRNYLYGDGIIEVMLGYNGRVVACAQHLTRLYLSASALKLQLPWTQDELEQELTAIAAMLPQGKSYLRLSISSGKGTGVARTKVDPHKTIICLPITVSSSSALSLCTAMRLGGIHTAKTPSYLESIVAILDANAAGYDDVLWINAKQQITETSAANIFFLREENGQYSCHTPHKGCGLLAGVTAAIITQILARHGIAVSSRVISKNEVSDYTGAFLSSSIKGLQWVKRIDEHLYPPPTAGFQQILAWEEERLQY